MARIHDSILSTVGDTPIVRLARLGRNLQQEIYGKCEFLSPGGSIKDRIAVRMVEGLEKAEVAEVQGMKHETGSTRAQSPALKSR